MSNLSIHQKSHFANILISAVLLVAFVLMGAFTGRAFVQRRAEVTARYNCRGAARAMRTWFIHYCRPLLGQLLAAV